MSGPRLEVRPLRVGDLQAAVDRALVSFGATQDAAALTERLRRRIERGHMMAVAEGDDVLAHATITPVEHWFGGRRVPCQHVAGVAVGPEARGQGAATALLTEVIRQGAHRGLGLSLLFPATDAPYRRLGWEQAGTYARWRLAGRHAPADGPRMRRLEPGRDWAGVRSCHERFGATQPCLESRGDDRWEQLATATFGWVRDAGDGSFDAYLLADHEDLPGDWRHRLAVRDWAATTPEGLRAVVALVAQHRSTTAHATLRGAMPHPWQLVVPEQDLELDGHFCWMARGLDLPAAVTAMGVSAAARTDVAFAIDDAVLGEEASGPWRLQAADGKASLSRTDAAPAARLDATAVGPLLTGHRSAEQLAAAGRASGDASALAALSATFAGPPPTLTDLF